MIGLADLARLCGMSRGATYNGLKQVMTLGFASVETGPRPRGIYTIRLLDKWRGIDVDEAGRLQLRARLPMAKPRPVTSPRVARHTPSLPRMPWDDAR